MTKKRPSMVDEMEFPNKTRQFLDFVGVTRSLSQPEIQSEFQSEMQIETSIAADSSQPSELVDALPLGQIQLPAQQPRRYFEAEAMQSLIVSIQEHGILQPLLVRPLLSGMYELVAGERRYRAAQKLELEEVPVIIRDLNDHDAMQVALLENLQREDLNPIEETEAILQLLSIRMQSSPEEVTSLLNHVANLQKQGVEITNNVVRSQWETLEHVFAVIGRLTPDSFRSHRLPLLNLPDDILAVLRQGKIEYTKARTIAQLKKPEQRHQLLEETVQSGLSVREIKKRLQTIQTAQINQGDLSPYPDQTEPLSATAVSLSRMRDVYYKVKSAKVWADPRKAKALEKLLVQIESLIVD